MSSGYDKYFKTAKLHKNVREHRSDSSDSLEKKNLTSNLKKSLKKSQQQNRASNQEKRTFPMGPMFLFLVMVSGLGVSIQYLDQIEEFLSNLEISMSSASAETEAKATPAAPDSKGEVKQETPAATAPAAAPPSGVTTVTPDDSTDYLFKLAARKKELDQREEELVRREEQVSKLKEEVEGKLKEIQGYRNSIAVLLQDRVSTDSAKVDTLVQVYSNMKPSQAAKVFETMDEDLVIEILSKMKKKNAADILNLVKADKAQVLAEKYAGYRLSGRGVASTNTNNKSTEQNDQNKQKEDSEE